MRIWVDADACPKVIKEVLYRAAERARIMTTLVANQMLSVPRSPWIQAMQVPQGFDVADARIVELAEPGDLVISADIPLAAAAIEKGAWVLDPRGDLLTQASIGERLAVRDFMQGLRDSGVETGGPASFSQADKQAFANQLDRLLARVGKR